MITRVLLVIALLGCLALAQNGSRGKCLCGRTREKFGNPKAIQDVQIYPPSRSCDKMEIVVHQKNGKQYCLDPKAKKVRELIWHLQNNPGGSRGSGGSSGSGGSRRKCACGRTRAGLGSSRAIQDIQIYPPSHTCDKLEIVVLQKSGMQYCLDPKVKKVQDGIKRLQVT